MKSFDLAIVFAALAMMPGAPVRGAPVAEKHIPDFGGPWMSTHARKFIPSATGPSPVMDDPAHPHMARGVTADGRDFGTTAWVGDWRNPNLMPWVANAVKEAGEADMAGNAIPTAESTCWPAGVPNIMNFFEPAFFLQTPDQVTILYQRGPNVRHIYLNRPHSARIQPSWYGESIGHYEDDTLVVDTIGFNGNTVLDSYHTPHSDQLHVIERYRVRKGKAEPDMPAQGDAFVFTGDTLEVDFRVEDPVAFRQPWSATARYRHVNRAALEESICAENNTDPVAGKIFPIPVATKPDF
jgi:hypothetical protein